MDDSPLDDRLGVTNHDSAPDRPDGVTDRGVRALRTAATEAHLRWIGAMSRSRPHRAEVAAGPPQRDEPQGRSLFRDVPMCPAVPFTVTYSAGGVLVMSVVIASAVRSRKPDRRGAALAVLTGSSPSSRRLFECSSEAVAPLWGCLLRPTAQRAPLRFLDGYSSGYSGRPQRTKTSPEQCSGDVSPGSGGRI